MKEKKLPLHINLSTEQICNEYLEEGMSTKKLAKKYNCTPNAIAYHLSKSKDPRVKEKLVAKRKTKFEDRVCVVCGSTQNVQRYHYEVPLCSKHKHHMQRHGKILERTIYDKNDILLYEEYAEVVLRNKQFEETARIKVSLDKVELIKDIKWHLHNTSKYAASMTGSKTIWMHRLITNCPDDLEVDHINGDKTDNRNENLRICTHHQNTWNTCIPRHNTSGVKGVSYNKQINKWIAQIVYNHKGMHIGSYDKFEDAVKARKEVEEKLFGEFMRKEEGDDKL